MVEAPASVTGQESLAEVLGRTARYVATFQHQLSSIVAEESYVQDATTPAATGSERRGVMPAERPAHVHRELRSDLLLIRPPGADRYVEYRDVFEVDGRPVRDRAERLSRIALDPSASAATQLRTIIDESARYNIGRITRNLNTPTLPLLFLASSHQHRFRFSRSSRDEAASAAGTRADEPAASFRVSAEVWAIGFREVVRPTLVRAPNGRNIPLQGRFWIEPDTGRVLLSELRADDADVSATIEVSYQSEPLLGLLVPVEMRERYEGRRDGTVVVGTARYGRFRLAQVGGSDGVVSPSRR